MTVQDPYGPPPTPLAPEGRTVVGRALAGAIAVFLGGYLLLQFFAGGSMQVAILLMAPEGRGPMLPFEQVALVMLQFAFALGVVATGMLLPRGPAVPRIVGAALATVGPLLAFFWLGARYSGSLRFDVERDARPIVDSLLFNPWFHVVLIVGVAWLISRRARLGWLSLVGVVVLIPIPTTFLLAGIGTPIVSIVMLGLSALVGAGIIVAGRPWRE